MPWPLRGLRNGIVTTSYPRRRDEYADSWRGGVDVVAPEQREDADVAALCPTSAITRDGDRRVSLDRGRCILCGACVRARPDRFAWAAGIETARLGRRALVVPQRDEDDAALAVLRADLAHRVRAFGRSVHVRHIDTGSDGSDEWEVKALTNPVYDVHRLGIFLTASPRHADLLLITGAGSHGMAAPLARTLEATARPAVVVAAGTDAASGGIIRPSYATAGGIVDLIDVDVRVPGSPASPFALLHGILLALGRLREVPQ
jgi:Ni,Fe-hydrogenase III small subunit/ferredoxin